MIVMTVYVCLASLVGPCTRAAAVAQFECLSAIKYTTCPTDSDIDRYQIGLPTGHYRVGFGPTLTTLER
jgi:hypothetical protein